MPGENEGNAGNIPPTPLSSLVKLSGGDVGGLVLTGYDEKFVKEFTHKIDSDDLKIVTDILHYTGIDPKQKKLFEIRFGLFLRFGKKGLEKVWKIGRCAACFARCSFLFVHGRGVLRSELVPARAWLHLKALTAHGSCSVRVRTRTMGRDTNVFSTAHESGSLRMRVRLLVRDRNVLAEGRAQASSRVAS